MLIFTLECFKKSYKNVKILLNRNEKNRTFYKLLRENIINILVCTFYLFIYFLLFGATPKAYGSS